MADKGRIFRELRRRKGFTLESIASQLDCSKQYLSAVERGDKSPSSNIYFRWVRVLGITPKTFEEYVRLGSIHRNSDLNEPIQSKRSGRVEITVEGQVLKFLRERKGLSLRKAAFLANCSDSLIAHTENGRNNPPKGDTLKKLLVAYGTSEREYNKLIKEWSRELPLIHSVKAKLSALNNEQLKKVSKFIDELN